MEGLMNYTPVRPTNVQEFLSKGRHDVVISRIAVVTDRMKDWTGTLKTPQELEEAGVDWKDSHEQLGITFTNSEGMVTTRLNTVGFMRYNQMTDTEGYYASTGDEGYAIDENTHERVISEKNRGIAMDIIAQLFASCEKQNEDGTWSPLCDYDEEGNDKNGAQLKDLVKCRLNIEVTPKQYKGKDVPPEVGNFRKFGYGSSESIKVQTPAEETVEETAESATGQTEDNF